MYLSFLLDIFKKNEDKVAIIWRDQKITYKELLQMVDEAEVILKNNNISEGDIVALRADFNPKSISYLLALINNQNIIVPISFAVNNFEEFYTIAEVEKIIQINENKVVITETNNNVKHQINISLKSIKHPGLVLFSSGSTGKSKAAVHDFVPLLEKFKVKRKLMKTITFLLFDHIGGVNTLFYILSNAGTIITIENRSPANVCKMIEKYNVELLPTSPTFMNMILMSKAYEKYNLSSLKLMTYGTESMPEQTLKAFNRIFPNITLKQTYGLSEIGIMRSKSKDNNSLWMKIGGEDYDIKIVDDVLYIKAKTAMLGYLNAPSPFDEEGWFNTQDKVEVDGEWIKILGRVSDIINVGGQKVYPAEVESLLLGMDNVQEVSVFAKDNPIMGKVVGARFNLFTTESQSSLKKRVRNYCKNSIESYKIPVYIEITNDQQVSNRFKKLR